MAKRFHFDKRFDPDPKDEVRYIEVVEIARAELEASLMLSWEALRHVVKPQQLKTVMSSKLKIDRVPDGHAWLRQGRQGGVFAGRPVLYQQGW